jgi:alpha-ketoglutarate-dependent taurine dioxygenase
MPSKLASVCRYIYYQRYYSYKVLPFKRILPDCAIPKIIQHPNDAGGDTLWASGYEAYGRLSPDIQKLVEGLTATHYQPNFVKVKEEFGEDLIYDYRGASENAGLDFKAEQVCIPHICLQLISFSVPC